MVFRAIGLYEILNRNNGYVLSIWGIYPWSGICISLWEYPGLCSLERPRALPIMEFMGPGSPALAFCTSRSRNETGTLLDEGYSWNFSEWYSNMRALAFFCLCTDVGRDTRLFLKHDFPLDLTVFPFSSFLEVLWHLNILLMCFFYVTSTRQMHFWVFDCITYK